MSGPLGMGDLFQTCVYLGHCIYIYSFWMFLNMHVCVSVCVLSVTPCVSGFLGMSGCVSLVVCMDPWLCVCVFWSTCELLELRSARVCARARASVPACMRTCTFRVPTAVLHLSASLVCVQVGSGCASLSRLTGLSAFALIPGMEARVDSRNVCTTVSVLCVSTGVFVGNPQVTYHMKP